MRVMPPRDAHYRRGTIMGLTAAEAFMLICFILLLIISLWQRQNLDKLRAVNEQLQQATAFENAFTESQRLAAITYKDELQQLGDNLQEVKTFEELLAEAGGEAQFRETLQTLREVRHVPPNEVVERVRMLDDPLIRRIAQATAELPAETRRKLAELTSVEQFEAMIEVAFSSSERLVRAMEELKEFETLELTPDEIRALRDQLIAYDQTGLDPQDIRRLMAIATEVDGLTEEVILFRASGLTPGEAMKLADAFEQLRNADAQSGADIAAAIRDRAGSLIAEMGGQILENGSVTFPDGVLFEPGKSTLKPEFDRVLSRFCQPWLEVLQDFDTSLRNVQIEGHASSEWNDASPPIAFINNLVLSQARAATVFQRCLYYVGTDELGTWARTRLAAVGYSSSRLVLTAEGNEDRERSRRVVFALDVKTADDLLIEDLLAIEPTKAAAELPVEAFVPAELRDASQAVTPSIVSHPNDHRKLDGIVEAVVDGDTLFVGVEKIRLQGLHAPELRDPLGVEAKELLESAVLGKQATCWMTGSTTFDRSEGVCVVDSLDVATVVIANGMGRDCPGFSNGRYRELEAAVDYPITLELPEYCTQ